MYDKNNDYGVSDEVAKEGSDFMSSLFDANIQHSFNGLGGCKKFVLTDFPERWHKLILAYLNEEIDATTACYIIMREKEQSA